MELKYNADYKTGAIKLADALGVGAARRQLGISQKPYITGVEQSDLPKERSVAYNKGFSDASWQRCKVHFMHNILAHVLHKEKNIFAQ